MVIGHIHNYSGLIHAVRVCVCVSVCNDGGLITDTERAGLCVAEN